ncbi:MAG: IS256 family transposase [Cyanobacteria bacterium P01_D01_bin.36]
MTDLLTDLGKIAGVFAFLGYIPYLMSIVRRKTLPNPATWWIWSIMGGILFASYYLEGNREAIWVPLSYFIGPTVTGILSLKYGRNEFGSFEKYCLGGAALSLVLWQVSGPVVALTMLIMIDLIAIAPTLRKTYFKPNSEDPLAWSIFWVANTINLYVVIASEAPTYATIAYPLELFFLPTSIMLLVIRGKLLGLDKSPRQQLQEAYATSSAYTNQNYAPPVDSTYAQSNQETANKAQQQPNTAFRAPKPNETFDASLSQLVRQGARQIISQAVAAELNEFLTQQNMFPASINNTEFSSNTQKNETLGDPLSTPSAQHKEAHKADITEASLPPYLHNSSAEEILPWLCLNGLPTQALTQKLSKILGPNTTSWTVAAINQLQNTWAQEHQTWQTRSLSRQRYAYIWADSIYLNSQNDLYSCLLIIMGMSADGYPELLGLSTGEPSSEESWKSLLLQIQSQGLSHDPQLAIGKNNLGLWPALAQVFPTTQKQECWDYKTKQILQKLPSKLQQKGNQALWEIYRSETKTDAIEAFDQFVETFQTKYPEATEYLLEDPEALLSFYSFPAEHWQTLRNTSLIEAMFATLRAHTTSVERELLDQSRDQTVPSYTLKLIQSAKKQWQRMQGFIYLGQVIEGVEFTDGVQLEDTKPNYNDQQTAA